MCSTGEAVSLSESRAAAALPEAGSCAGQGEVADKPRSGASVPLRAHWPRRWLRQGGAHCRPTKKNAARGLQRAPSV